MAGVPQEGGLQRHKTANESSTLVSLACHRPPPVGDSISRDYCDSKCGWAMGRQRAHRDKRPGYGELLALQFAAKLHELLMLSSLGEILFSETVKQLVFGDGLPLGAIAAGLQFDQISYLWSKEFRATSCATFKRKYLIIPAIIICTLLGVSIGPSSATAIKPTLGDWPAGETSFWLNRTAQELWHSTLSLTGNKPVPTHHRHAPV